MNGFLVVAVIAIGANAAPQDVVNSLDSLQAQQSPQSNNPYVGAQYPGAMSPMSPMTLPAMMSPGMPMGMSPAMSPGPGQWGGPPSYNPQPNWNQGPPQWNQQPPQWNQAPPQWNYPGGGYPGGYPGGNDFQPAIEGGSEPSSSDSDDSSSPSPSYPGTSVGLPNWGQSWTPMGQSPCYSRCRPKCYQPLQPFRPPYNPPPMPTRPPYIPPPPPPQPPRPPQMQCYKVCRPVCNIRPTCGYGGATMYGQTMTCGNGRPPYNGGMFQQPPMYGGMYGQGMYGGGMYDYPTAPVGGLGAPSQPQETADFEIGSNNGTSTTS